MNDRLRQRLWRLPKAEMHLHLEGTLTARDLLELSRRHGFPHGLQNLEACQLLYDIRDFPGFIQAIKTASQHLIAPEDYGWTVRQMGRRLAAQSIVYAEVFVSIGILHWKQMPVDAVWLEIEAARRELAAETNLRLAWIFDAVRQFGAAAAERVVDEAIRLKAEGPVVGIGIGGDENGGPAEWFEAAYRRAEAAGLGLTAHAGETSGPESVWAAVDKLHAQRIGHGLAAALDPGLLARLAAGGQQIDVCTISNRKTGCIAAQATHPVLKFDEHSVRWAPASDDPGIFSCSLIEEIYECSHQWRRPWRPLRRALRQAFAGAFLVAGEKAAYLDRFDRAWEALGLP